MSETQLITTDPAQPDPATSSNAVIALLEKDPTLWQREETLGMIAYFRSQRHRFAQDKAVQAAGGEKARTKNPAKTKKPPAALAPPIPGLELDLS